MDDNRPTKAVIRPTLADLKREFCRLLRGNTSTTPRPACKPFPLVWICACAADDEAHSFLSSLGFAVRLVEPVRQVRRTLRDGEA